MSPGCGLFVLVHLENWFSVTENAVSFLNDFSESAAFEKQNVRGIVFRPITEQVLLWWMPVKIKVELKLSLVFLLEFDGKFVQSKYFRIDWFVEFIELPIEIFPAITRPKISYNHSVWIKHRHDVEHIHLSYLFRNLIIFKKLSNKSLQNMRSVWLAWMDSCCYQYSSFLLVLFKWNLCFIQ